MYRITPRQIQGNASIRIWRTLPAPGEILVSNGQKVTPSDVIGRASLPHDFVVVDVAAALNLSSVDLKTVLLKNSGDAVEEAELVAEYKSRFWPFKRVCHSPAKGIISAVGGNRILIETEKRVAEVTAQVSGTVCRVNHGRSVTIETVGACIEAAFGLGQDGYGSLKVIADAAVNLNPQVFDSLKPHTIVVTGGSVDEATIRRAEELGLAGLIVGSIDAALLEMIPPPQIPVVATEGFGDRVMAATTFNLLAAGDAVGAQVSILLHEHRHMSHPVMVLSSPTPITPNTLPAPDGLAGVGSCVRTLRNPHPLVWGNIVAVPDLPRRAACGNEYFGAEISTPTGTEFVPWANLEHLG